MTNLESALNDYFGTNDYNIYDFINMIEQESRNERDLLIEIKGLLEWLNEQID